jgi:hypothetical protein
MTPTRRVRTEPFRIRRRRSVVHQHATADGAVCGTAHVHSSTPHVTRVTRVGPLAFSSVWVPSTVGGRRVPRVGGSTRPLLLSSAGAARPSRSLHSSVQLLHLTRGEAFSLLFPNLVLIKLSSIVHIYTPHSTNCERIQVSVSCDSFTFNPHSLIGVPWQLVESTGPRLPSP